jgi:succinate dehydrogenase / fumarate reductase cytochrome b subunit
LGVVLPVVEWAFIFLPILFHGIFGVWIIQSGHSNLARYRYTSNFRYAAQRWTGVIALCLFSFTSFTCTAGSILKLGYMRYSLGA